MSKTKILWLAKDFPPYTMIGVYRSKPKIGESFPFFVGDFVGQIYGKVFPELTYENSPVKVELRIIDDEND